MTRIVRNFSARPTSEQEWMLENTWCDSCREADVGMDSPQEYEEQGKIYVEGSCRRCGARVRSEVNEVDNS